MTPAARNLVALYERNAQREADLQWYAEARELVTRDADAHGIDRATYVAIVAALSPQQAWETANGKMPNLDRAREFVTTGDARTFKHAVRNARAILDGANPDNVLGPKTRAFYHALMGADDVVLDRWALRAIGWPRESITQRELERASAPYHEAAQHLNVSPAALQAATWTQIRRESK